MLALTLGATLLLVVTVGLVSWLIPGEKTVLLTAENLEQADDCGRPTDPRTTISIWQSGGFVPEPCTWKFATDR